MNKLTLKDHPCLHIQDHSDALKMKMWIGMIETEEESEDDKR
jgi:hypothetical protein